MTRGFIIAGVAGFVAGVAILAAALEPSRLDWVALEIADRRDDQAERRARAALDDKEVAAEAWLQLAKISSHRGDVVELEKALNAYVDLKPEDLSARDALIGFYMQTRRMPEALEQAELAYRQDPTEPRLKALVGWTRISGDREKAMDLLEEGLRDGVLGDDAALTAIGDLSAAGRDEALIALLDAADRQEGRLSAECRGAFFLLLVASGDVSGALERARRWTLTRRDMPLLAANVATLRRYGRARTANALAMEAIALGPAVAPALVQALTAQDAAAAAQAYLLHFAARLAPMAPAQRAAVAEAAAHLPDPAPIVRAFALYGFERLAPPTRAALADGLVARHGPRGAAAMRRLLTEPELRMRPLLGAALMLHERRPQAARRYLRLAAEGALTEAQAERFRRLVGRLDPRLRGDFEQRVAALAEANRSAAPGDRPEAPR